MRTIVNTIPSKLIHVNTRQESRCASCGGSIPVGITCERHTGIRNNQAYDFLLHNQCEAFEFLFTQQIGMSPLEAELESREDTLFHRDVQIAMNQLRQKTGSNLYCHA